MLVFGVWGYLMRKLGIPIAPLLIAFLLVPMLERSFRQALLISGGDPTIFLTRPISAGFLLVAALWIGWRILQGGRSRTPKT
jgi:putative tricarboxylic transport membrane protein